LAPPIAYNLALFLYYPDVSTESTYSYSAKLVKLGSG